MSIWSAWVEKTTNAATPAEIARKTQHHRNTIVSWLDKPTMSAVRDISAAYSADILEGLYAAGLIDAAQVRRAHPRVALRTISSLALAEELAERLRADATVQHPSTCGERIDTSS